MDREIFRRRRLPHLDVPGAAYFVTTCLHGSIPAQGLLDIERHRQQLQNRPTPPGLSKLEVKRTRWKQAFARMDRWLDGEPAIRYLENPALAQVVVDAFYHFAGQQYDLLGFVVMPSHLHWAFQPRDEWVQTLANNDLPRQRICKSRHQHTALECNWLLDRQGQFWQHESYDHWIRDVDEMERILHYIEANPVKAGLAKTPSEWRFSSAYERTIKGLELGQPLTR